MSEFGEAKGPLPLITGEYIPNSRTTLGLDQLLPLVEDRKVTLIQRSFREIQMRLRKDANTLLPESIDKTFGLTGLFFAELSHPDSRPIVFAGFGNYKDLMVGSLNKAVAFIDLDRSTGIGWSGNTGLKYNNRLLPVSIGISGIDKQAKRIVSAVYDAEYNFPAEENLLGSVAFVLDEAGISVSREDGFEFKEGRGGLDSLPYNYASQYYEGIFTKEMFAKAKGNGRQVFPNRVNVGRHPRFGLPRLEIPLRLEPHFAIGLLNYPNDFEVNTSDNLVKIGRKNIWEINVPETLPVISNNPKFLQTRK